MTTIRRYDSGPLTVACQGTHGFAFLGEYPIATVAPGTWSTHEETWRALLLLVEGYMETMLNDVGNEIGRLNEKERDE